MKIIYIALTSETGKATHKIFKFCRFYIQEPKIAWISLFNFLHLLFCLLKAVVSPDSCTVYRNFWENVSPREGMGVLPYWVKNVLGLRLCKHVEVNSFGLIKGFNM